MSHQDRSEDVRVRLDRHDREIVSIRSDLTHLQSSVDDVKSGLLQQDHKIDSVLSAINETRRGVGTRDVAAMMQILVMCGALCAGVVSGIVYISSNANSADMALLKYRVDQMRGSFGWEPVIVKRTQ